MTDENTTTTPTTDNPFKSFSTIGLMGAIAAGAMFLLNRIGKRRDDQELRDSDRTKAVEDEVSLLKEMRQVERLEEQHRGYMRLLEEQHNAQIDVQRMTIAATAEHKLRQRAAEAEEVYWHAKLGSPFTGADALSFMRAYFEEHVLGAKTTDQEAQAFAQCIEAIEAKMKAAR